MIRILTWLQFDPVGSSGRRSMFELQRDVFGQVRRSDTFTRLMRNVVFEDTDIHKQG